MAAPSGTFGARPPRERPRQAGLDTTPRPLFCRQAPDSVLRPSVADARGRVALT